MLAGLPANRCVGGGTAIKARGVMVCEIVVVQVEPADWLGIFAVSTVRRAVRSLAQIYLSIASKWIKSTIKPHENS